MTVHMLGIHAQILCTGWRIRIASVIRNKQILQVCANRFYLRLSSASPSTSYALLSFAVNTCASFSLPLFLSGCHLSTNLWYKIISSFCLGEITSTQNIARVKRKCEWRWVNRKSQSHRELGAEVALNSLSVSRSYCRVGSFWR